MKKPASPVKAEKTPKRTPEEKAARKSTKKAGRATTELTDDRASKKASQKKSLKSAAKQLQKELNSRMNEVVTRIRKETKAKLKEVVKEATRRLDGDTERMFEQALHTIVRHYDSVAGTPKADTGSSDAAAPAGQGKKGPKKGLTLNKDGSPRKSRTLRGEAAATPGKRGSKPATGAKRGPKPRNQVALAADATATEKSPATPATPRSPAKKPAAKPAAKRATPAAAEPEATGLLNSANSASTGEVSE